jgi:hypothetical protein
MRKCENMQMKELNGDRITSLTNQASKNQTSEILILCLEIISKPLSGI